MDAIHTLKTLTAQMTLEPAEDHGCPQLSRRQDESIMISHATLPNGQRIRLLKTLLTSVCERNCNYCPFRAGRDFRRAAFQPDQFAATFMTLHRHGAVDGLFISSGVVNGGMRTQDQLLDTAEILRRRMRFAGYLHLKIMPGAEEAQVERAMQLADRVSINLEAPNTYRLADLAPGKHFTNELLQPLKWVEEIRRSQSPAQGWNRRWPSSVTQFVVGGVGESDLELLHTTQYLYRQLNLRRAYFSAFNPIPDTPLENHPAEQQARENRLYQASFLLRDYGFTLEELPFVGNGSLPQNTDPKLAWALHHLNEQPIEINRAERAELLRIPGIGPKSADTILQARRQDKLRSLSALSKLGIQIQRAAPFILLDGRRPAHQIPLF